MILHQIYDYMHNFFFPSPQMSHLTLHLFVCCYDFIPLHCFVFLFLYFGQSLITTAVSDGVHVLNIGVLDERIYKPMGSPRTCSGEGRAKRNFLVS